MRLPVEPFKEPSDVDSSSSESSEPESDETPSSGEGQAGPPLKRPEMICAVREYEGRFNLRGEKVVKAVEPSVEVDVKEKEEGKEYAMSSYKHYHRDGQLQNSYVEIYSQHIKEALRTVVKTYPGVSFQGDMIIINGELRCIFHYRKELENYRQTLQDPISKLHIRLLLRFMEQQLRDQIKSYTAHVETATNDPSLEFNNLWMGFVPGEIIITGRYEAIQLLALKSMNITKTNCGKFWRITGNCLTHDGTHFGYSNKIVDVGAFEGTKLIRNLNVMPFRFFRDETVRESIRERLIRRGEKFCSLVGYHHRLYKGVAYALMERMDFDEAVAPGAPSYKHRLETVTINSRIMVDSKSFGVSKSPNRVWLTDRKMVAANATSQLESLTTQDLMTCDFQIPGFSLSDKKWCWFSVDFIDPVMFNAHAFKSLLLPQRQKDIVHALAKNHGSDDFDDMIKGKGRGLVFVLYGEPGVGKTFTAESVADDIQRPLYVLNSGELGVDPTAVEEILTSALKLAQHWGAIVLIDEADVFLEQRTIHDLTRNALVSLFLRTLEYYEGILFLTTNRLTRFDSAFKSRIHLALRYSALTQERRKELWKLFIERTSKDALQTWPDSVFDDLAKVNLNGRQIKNAIRTANTLARSTQTALGREHIEIVLDTIKEFEEDFSNSAEDAEMSETLDRETKTDVDGRGARETGPKGRRTDLTFSQSEAQSSCSLGNCGGSVLE